jgi:hypothetical protein
MVCYTYVPVAVSGLLMVRERLVLGVTDGPSVDELRTNVMALKLVNGIGI